MLFSGGLTFFEMGKQRSSLSTRCCSLGSVIVENAAQPPDDGKNMKHASHFGKEIWKAGF